VRDSSKEFLLRTHLSQHLLEGETQSLSRNAEVLGFREHPIGLTEIFGKLVVGRGWLFRGPLKDLLRGDRKIVTTITRHG
jgi:hypothetical protein